MAEKTEPRRYTNDRNGNARRTWFGKLPEDFSDQDVRRFISETNQVLHTGKEQLSMAKKDTPGKQTPAQEAAFSVKLEARAYPLEEPKGSTVAYASVNIADSFAVQGLRVVNGEKGMFVAMPSSKDKNGEYRDVAFPITADARKQLGAVVLDAYAKAVEKSHPELAAAAKAAKADLEKPSLTGQLKDKGKDSKAKPAPAKEKAAPDKSEVR